MPRVQGQSPRQFALKIDDGDVVQVLVTARDSGMPALGATYAVVINVAANRFPWQNHKAALDVNNDGDVSPIDVSPGQRPGETV